MEANFWRTRWQDGQIGFHQNDANPYLKQHWAALGVAAGGQVLVPLCGKSKDMVWLRSQGHSVLGVELSALATEAFFAENGLQATAVADGKFMRSSAAGYDLLCGDFFDLGRRECANVAAVYDRASLIALPTEMRDRYAHALTALLEPGTPVLLVTMEYPVEESEGPPFSVDEKEVRRLYQGAFDIRHVGTEDVLVNNPRFRERGVTSLQEKTYILRRL